LLRRPLVAKFTPRVIESSKSSATLSEHEGFISERVCSVKVDIDEATAIYARACRAWYGKLAPRVVKDRLRELARRGDTSGVAAWTKVAHHLTRLEGSERRNGAHGKLY
jgi:hypothetical protein